MQCSTRNTDFCLRLKLARFQSATEHGLNFLFREYPEHVKTALEKRGICRRGRAVIPLSCYFSPAPMFTTLENGWEFLPLLSRRIFDCVCRSDTDNERSQTKQKRTGSRTQRSNNPNRNTHTFNRFTAYPDPNHPDGFRFWYPRCSIDRNYQNKRISIKSVLTD